MIPKRFADTTDPELAALYQGGDLGDPKALAARLVRRSTPNESDAGGEFVRRHSGLIAKTARAFAHRDELDDLLQVSRVGFLDGCARFKANGGAKVVTYALVWAHAACTRHLAQHGSLVRVPRPTPARPATKWAAMADVARLAPTDLVDLVTSSDVPSALDLLIADESTCDLLTVAASLDGRDRQVIELRWLGGEVATPADVGFVMGITGARVGQLEQVALGKLRARLARAA